MKKSYLLLHIAVILAGFTGVFGKLISLNDGILVWYRVLFSSIFLFLLVSIFRKKEKINLNQKVEISKVGLLITTHWVFFYASIRYSNISVGVICYCLTSLFTAIFDPLLNKKSFSVQQLLLSFLTLIGISLIFHLDANYQFGIILGVFSSIFAALYTIYNERLVKKYDSMVINYYQMIGGTLGLGALLPFYLHYFPSSSFIPSTKDLIYLILLAGFCTVMLYVIFAESLKTISAFTVNLSFNLEPLYAIVLAFLFFNEGRELNIGFYLGCSVVLTSVLLQSVTANKKIVIS